MASPSRNQPKPPPQWTLDELRSLAEQIIESAGVASENGRVRSTPDERTLRYYTTIGLLSRPDAFRGRTALYGRQHLAQVVAIKRLQSLGMPLSAIQIKLTGLTPAELERTAILPSPLPEATHSESWSEAVRQERPPKRESRSAPQSAAPRRETSPTGSWIGLGAGVALMLPLPFTGNAEALMDILHAASPLIAELRRQGAIEHES